MRLVKSHYTSIDFKVMPMPYMSNCQLCQYVLIGTVSHTSISSIAYQYPTYWHTSAFELVWYKKTTTIPGLSQTHEFICTRDASGMLFSSFGLSPSCKVASEGTG